MSCSGVTDRIPLLPTAKSFGPWSFFPERQLESVDKLDGANVLDLAAKNGGVETIRYLGKVYYKRQQRVKQRIEAKMWGGEFVPSKSIDCTHLSRDMKVYLIKHSSSIVRWVEVSTTGTRQIERAITANFPSSNPGDFSKLGADKEQIHKVLTDSV
jgi:hypothetical protein